MGFLLMAVCRRNIQPRSGSRLSGPRKYTAGCFQPKHSIDYFSRASPNAPSGSIPQGLAGFQGVGDALARPEYPSRLGFNCK